SCRSKKPGAGETCRRSGDSAKAQVFDLEVFVHAVLRAFAAEARLLDAAKGSYFGRNETGIDADDAVLERLGNAPDARQILPVEVSGKAEFGRVGEFDRFRFVPETEERGEGAEGLFGGDGHLRGHVGQDRGLEEAPAESMALAAHQDFGAFLTSVANVVFDFG